MSIKEFELRHPGGLRISRSLRETELVSVFPDSDGSKFDMQTGWVWYRLPTFTDSEVVVGSSLGFNSGVLERVMLQDVHTKFGSSWNDWSEEKERLRAASISAWIRDIGFPVGNYSWGGVWAGYDSKGGFGHASVQFAAQQGAAADQCEKARTVG